MERFRTWLAEQNTGPDSRFQSSHDLHGSREIPAENSEPSRSLPLRAPVLRSAPRMIDQKPYPRLNAPRGRAATGDSDTERVRRLVPVAVVHAPVARFRNALAPPLAARMEGGMVPPAGTGRSTPVGPKRETASSIHAITSPSGNASPFK
jgi:hypothetical protein